MKMSHFRGAGSPLAWAYRWMWNRKQLIHSQHLQYNNKRMTFIYVCQCKKYLLSWRRVVVRTCENEFIWKTGGVSLFQSDSFAWKVTCYLGFCTKTYAMKSFGHITNHHILLFISSSVSDQTISLGLSYHHSTRWHYLKWIYEREGNLQLLRSSSKSMLPSLLYHCPYLTLGRSAEQTAT